MIVVHPGAVTRVLLVRHGQSDYNATGRFQGSLDEPQLTEKGWRMAVECGHHLKDTPLDAIFCSSLRRARQTADVIISTYGDDTPAPPIHYDVRLREVHLPGWEGQSIQHVQDTSSATYRLWKRNPDQLVLACNSSTGLGFSPLGDMACRASEFWDELLLDRCGQAVLIIGHGSAIGVMLCVALKLPLQEVHNIQQSNGGVSSLEFVADQAMSARALYINRTQHLGEGLPKMKEGPVGHRILLLTADCAARMDWSALLPGTAVEFVPRFSSAQIITRACFINRFGLKLGTSA